LHDLPPALVEQAFDRVGTRYCVKPKHRAGIEFLDQDLRSEMPTRHFDLILCRYVAFTYFSAQLQRTVLARMLERLRPGGYLVIGTHEQLPGRRPELSVTAPHIFQKKKDASGMGSLPPAEVGGGHDPQAAGALEASSVNGGKS
jgi:chemotaxis protein methyltransferase CheR